VKPTRTNWFQHLGFVCVIGPAFLVNCGNDSPSGGSTPADAAADVSDAGLTTEQKASMCQSNATLPLLQCGCESCPATVYDCYYADGDIAAACKTIVACVISSGCSDSASCTNACSTVIQANVIGMQEVLALQSCIMTHCSSLIDAGIDGGPYGDGAAVDGSMDVAAADDIASGGASPDTDSEALAQKAGDAVSRQVFTRSLFSWERPGHDHLPSP
jgi:hypothetical protein